MSSKEKTEKKEEQSFSFILNAPKLKLMKPSITPTPFSLNDSFSDEMDDSTDVDIPYDENNTEEFINNKNATKTIFTALKIKRI